MHQQKISPVPTVLEEIPKLRSSVEAEVIEVICSEEQTKESHCHTYPKLKRKKKNPRL